VKNGSSIQIIEDVGDGSQEWGISFCGSNPPLEDYFTVKDKKTAFRLRDRLTINSPITLDKPRTFCG
jgi:hypothetical protein